MLNFTRLNIMTPAFRLENLPKIQASIEACGVDLPLMWWVIYDHNVELSTIKKHINLRGKFPIILNQLPYDATDDFGYHKRNYFLDLCETGFVYFLDDDNLFHESIAYSGLSALHTSVMVNQIDKHGNMRIPHTNPIEVGKVDLASFILRRSDIGDLRFNNSYTADGELYHKLFVELNLPIHRTDLITSYYNKLK